MSQFELETLGEFSVYPGHPVTVGLVIMARFKNFDEANDKSKSGPPAALVSYDVPGGGGEVYQAMDLLYKIKKGAPVEAAIKEVHDDWQAGGHRARIEEGKAQAERFMPRYIEKVKEWIKL